ncbi:MAG: MFS transporter [Wenzhouxiangellaceae bacterium]
MHAIISVASLLAGIAIILAGNGLLGTVLGLRGQIEGIAPGQLGVIMSAYFAGFMAGTFWVPGLIRRVGHIRVFATMASVASVTALLHGLLVDPVLWLLLRAVSGVCLVGVYISIESWLNARVSNAQRGHVFSAYVTTTLMGLGVGQLLLMSADPAGLELFALASVLLSLGLVPVAMTRVDQPALPVARRLGLRRLYEISPLGVVGSLCAGLAAGSFWGLAPVFASAVGLDTNGVALFMAMTILGGVLMLWPIGRLSDHYERRRVLTLVCACSALTAAVVAIVVELDIRFLMLAGLCWGAFGFSLYALSAAHTNDQVEAEHTLEVAASLQMIWAVGAIAGPIAAGALMQRLAPEALMVFIAVSSLLPALFALWRMRVRKAIPVEAQRDFVPLYSSAPVALQLPDEDDSEGLCADLEPDEDEVVDAGDLDDPVRNGP